jgi:iron complex outermembrane recepter protein
MSAALCELLRQTGRTSKVMHDDSLRLKMPLQAAVSLACGLVCHSALQAQTLRDVVVSASRAEQSSFDASAAVQSIDRTVIEGAGPQVNLSESLNRVPGLTILNRQNYAQDLQLSIRGFGARSAFGIRGIRLLVDGIPATTPDGQGQGSSISLTSTERLEVLRGPLALLYGNSSGGVIQAFTRDAPAEPQFEAQYYAGFFGMHRSDWQYAGKVGAEGSQSGGVGIVADYSTFDTSGFRDNSRTERKQFNGKLSFGSGDTSKVNLVFNQFDMPLAQDPLGLTAAQLAANPGQAGTNALARSVRKTVLQNQLGASLVQGLADGSSITARVYYGTRDNLQFQVGGNTIPVTPTLNGAWVGLNRSYYGVGVQYNAQSSIAGTSVKWAAGYEFDRSREGRQAGGATGGQKTGVLLRDEVNQAENSDLFAQATALVSGQLSLTAGVRASTVRFTSDDGFLADGNGSGSSNYQAASPVLGATWHVSDSLNVYANYGKGFESPTLSEVAYSGSTAPLNPVFNAALNASQSEHYEMGAKWLPGTQSRLDFTAYQINTVDEIVTLFNSGGNTSFKNAPGTRRTGWELAASALLTPNWRGTLSASQIDATYTQTFKSGTTTITAGNRMPGIPQNLLFGELTWSQQGFDVPARRLAAQGLQMGLELAQAGRLFANDVNTASADGYATVNLKASHGWAFGRGNMTAYARVDNATDQNYVGSVIVNQAASQFFEPAPGRNWTLGLSLKVPL